MFGFSNSEIKCCKRTSASYFLMVLIVLNIFCLLFSNITWKHFRNVNNEAKYYYFLKKIPDQSKTRTLNFVHFETCFGDLFRIPSGKTLSPIY